MQKELIMRYPSSWHGEMWREGAPFGNGTIGGMVYGGIFKEKILLNHAFLWRGGKTPPLPEVSGALDKVRHLLDEHKPIEADSVLADALRQAGYRPQTMRPACLCDLTLETPLKKIFSGYRRRIRMDRAEVSVSWQEGEAHYERSVFASRVNQLVFLQYTCRKGRIDTVFSQELHDTETLKGMEAPETFTGSEEDRLYFSYENKSDYKPGCCGAVSRIFTDGQLVLTEKGAKITGASEILIVTGTFVGRKREEVFRELEDRLSGKFDYQEELEKHVRIHRALFETTELSLSDPCEHHSNEELLLDAYEEKASLELMEKLYAYGRYLFLCSTSDEGSLPCHLTGLFNGDYQCMWAFYMYNINFEMMYWHTLSGNLSSFMRSALDYVESFLADYRENAKKIYGCRGILINSVNTPESGLFKCMGNHIVNWTGGAAWLSQHFWDYYQYTLDEDYLRKHALPFLYETALFYEDFAVEAEDGYYRLYPSVSPENVPQNIRDITPPDRFVEISVDAALETALLKELLTNLLKGSEITGMYEEKRDRWKIMLQKIRPYRINREGALSEWIDDFYQDNYRHRHHSHLYPIFPGREITKGHPLYPAAVRAEDLRLEYGLSDQSNWSLLVMAGLAARMERGDLAFELLSTLSRTCLMNNLMSLSNDWRRMGPACCEDMRRAPLQLDGNIGLPAIIHEMLIQSSDSVIYILPALPEEWKHGEIKGLLLTGNILCNLKWDEQKAVIELTTEKVQKRRLHLGSGYQFGGQVQEQDIFLDRHIIITADGKKGDEGDK